MVGEDNLTYTALMTSVRLLPVDSDLADTLRMGSEHFRRRYGVAVAAETAPILRGVVEQTLGMAPGGIVKMWVGGSCLGFKEVGRFQAEVEPLGPYRGASKGKYVSLEPENKAYVEQHGIPYGSW